MTSDDETRLAAELARLAAARDWEEFDLVRGVYADLLESMHDARRNRLATLARLRWRPAGERTRQGGVPWSTDWECELQRPLAPVLLLAHPRLVLLFGTVNSLPLLFFGKGTLRLREFTRQARQDERRHITHLRWTYQHQRRGKGSYYDTGAIDPEGFAALLEPSLTLLSPRGR